MCKKVKCTYTYRTLGVMINAAGDCTRQLQLINDQIQRWKNKLEGSTLTIYEKLISYFSLKQPQITYPMPCMTVTHDQLRKTFRPMLDALLNNYGASVKFPTVLRHASPKYFGLSLDDSVVLQGSAQLIFLLGHVNMADRIGNQIQITIDTLEPIIGKGKSPLEFLGIINKNMFLEHE